MGAVTAWGAGIPWGEEAAGAEGHCSVFPSLLSQLCLSLTFKFAGSGNFLSGGGCPWALPEQFSWSQGLLLTWAQQPGSSRALVPTGLWVVSAGKFFCFPPTPFELRLPGNTD